jgi:AmmeMemoRadiSam system protein B
MVREPAVAGRFYPSDPFELSKLIRECLTQKEVAARPMPGKACLVPHAGYGYSGPIAGAVLGKIRIPRKIIVLGVRHRPPGSPAAIVSRGLWRTPVGDARIDEGLAAALREACPVLKEDPLAHRREHSLEVQLPFLQILAPEFAFVPIALGRVGFETLVKVGEGIARVLAAAKEEVLLLTTSDLNHYEDDATTRLKDRMAIEQLLKMDARGLFEVCRENDISMCGLGPAVAMLTALRFIGADHAELIRYATSGERSGDRRAVVGYAGMWFY